MYKQFPDSGCEVVGSSPTWITEVPVAQGRVYSLDLGKLALCYFLAFLIDQ